jgi:hypothetical protein
VRVAQGRAEPFEIGVKAMEAVWLLDCSREELLGVWGAERSDSGGGNWGDPPRPGNLRKFVAGSVASYNR